MICTGLGESSITTDFSTGFIGLDVVLVPLSATDTSAIMLTELSRYYLNFLENAQFFLTNFDEFYDFTI